MDYDRLFESLENQSFRRRWLKQALTYMADWTNYLSNPEVYQRWVNPLIFVLLKKVLIIWAWNSRVIRIEITKDRILYELFVNQSTYERTMTHIRSYSYVWVYLLFGSGLCAHSFFLSYFEWTNHVHMRKVSGYMVILTTGIHKCMKIRLNFCKNYNNNNHDMYFKVVHCKMGRSAEYILTFCFVCVFFLYMTRLIFHWT